MYFALKKSLESEKIFCLCLDIHCQKEYNNFINRKKSDLCLFLICVKSRLVFNK